MNRFVIPAVIALLLSPAISWAQQDKPKQPSLPTDEVADPEVKLPELPGLTPLSKNFGLWVDMKRKWVVVDGRVCLNRGVLEMFACPKNTKEHESVISVACEARFVHAALLAIGAAFLRRKGL